MSIGTRIIQIRNQKAMTQRQLSERSGIASSYLSRIENRRLEPRPKTLRKIAEALGIPVSEIFVERGAALGQVKCAISSSGKCIMELLEGGRRRRGKPGREGYSPRQLRLLRMTNYLVQTGDLRLLDALDVLLGSLLNASAGRKPPETVDSQLVTLQSRPQSL